MNEQPDAVESDHMEVTPIIAQPEHQEPAAALEPEPAQVNEEKVMHMEFSAEHEP